MAGTLTMDPVELFFDCAGTISLAVNGAAAATAANQKMAHLWGHVFCRFDDGSLPRVLRKTLGHATATDVAEGRSTHWEQKGNKHADRFAKMGAKAHGWTDKLAAEVRAIFAFQVRVCRFVGALAAWMVDNKLADTTELVGRAQAKAEAVAKPMLLKDLLAEIVRSPGFSRHEVDECVAAGRIQHLAGHDLRLAPVLGGKGKGAAVLMCMSCGGYSQQRLDLLGKSCKGRRFASQPSLRRVSLFRSGAHPVDTDVRLGGSWLPPISVASWFVERGGGQSAPGEKSVPNSPLYSAGAAGSPVYRRAMLASMGLQESHLAQLVAEEAARAAVFGRGVG